VEDLDLNSIRVILRGKRIFHGVRIILDPDPGYYLSTLTPKEVWEKV